MTKENNCMNIIKNYHGLKIVMLLYYLINIFSFNSCQSETDTLNEYTIFMNNQYFESLDSIYVDSIKKFNEVSVNETVILPYLKSGEHSFSLYTNSGLVISFKLTLAGSKENLYLNVNEQGKIGWQY